MTIERRASGGGHRPLADLVRLGEMPLRWTDVVVTHLVTRGGSRRWKVIAPPAILLTIPRVEVVDGLAVDPR
jgi:hypothetical protein